jgi:hypothetical protein
MFSSAYMIERYISPHPMLSFGSAGHWQCCIAPKVGALVVELDTAALDEPRSYRHRLATRPLTPGEAGVSPSSADALEHLQSGSVGPAPRTLAMPSKHQCGSSTRRGPDGGRG